MAEISRLSERVSNLESHVEKRDGLIDQLSEEVTKGSFGPSRPGGGG